MLRRGERVIVDEAGMLDPGTPPTHSSLSPLRRGELIALVGDRAQLHRGSGRRLDMAAQIRGCTYDMTELHRFTDPDYAALTLAMRDREDPR